MENTPFSLGQLAVWRHSPPNSHPTKKARILIVHGIGEHSGRHLNTVQFLLENGFEVVRFDLQGAGRSGGRRQWIAKFEDYVSDVVTVRNWIDSTLPPSPLFVLGHSLGGAISIYYASRFWKNLEGLILSAPAYLVGEAVSPLKIKIGKIVERIIPTIRIPKGGDPGAISRDPRVVREYVSDSLSCHFNTVHQGTEVLRALSLVLGEVKKIGCPTLIAHGTADKIIKLEGSFEILMHLLAKDKTLYALPNVYHEPHNDFGKEEYFSILSLWLRKHLK